MRCALLLFAATCTLAACSGGKVGGVDSELLAETATNVITFQTGTVEELRRRRGTGPFTRYEHAPDEMLDVIARAARNARGRGGKPVRAVFVSHRYREVIAKEREPAEADSEDYEGDFRTAVVATVHPIFGEPDASRVEIHAMQRGPFHQGSVRWEQSLPRWIDEVLREDAAPPPPGIKPIRPSETR